MRLGNPPELVRKLGLGQSVPTWSPDGSEIAWCGDDRATLVVDLEAGMQRSVPGCFPRFLPDDRLVTRDGSGPEASVFVDGTALLDERDLLDGFFFSRPAVVWAGGLHVLGSGAAPEGDLLVAIRTPGPTGQPTAVLERWQGEELRQAFPIPASYPPAVSFYGFRIEASPNGSEAAFLFPERLTPMAERLVALVDLRTGAAELGEGSYAGLAWSPDGAWLALTTGQEVQIFGVDRSAPAYVLPLATRGLAWTR